MRGRVRVGGPFAKKNRLMEVEKSGGTGKDGHVKKVRIIAAIIAALVVIFISLYAMVFGQASDEGSSDVVKKGAVVATVDIPAFTVITEDMVKTTDVVQDASNVNSFASADDVVGTVSLGAISKGEIVLSNHVRQTNTTAADGSTRPVVLPVEKGQRAMTIAVDLETGVSKLVRVGNRVDVIFVADDPEADSQKEAVILLENVKVLALDQALADPQPTVNEDGKKTTPKVTYENVTLSVAPTDTVKIAAAHDKGKLYLTLRSEGDAGKVGKSATSTEAML